MTGRSYQRMWRVGKHSVAVDVRLEEDVLAGVLREGETEHPVDARVHRTAPDAVVVRLHGEVHRAVVVRHRSTLWVALDGHTYELKVDTPGRSAARANTEHYAMSPMTGTLLEVAVDAGDVVAEGDTLFVVEAMKMEYAVRAPRDVTVATVAFQAGDKVNVDQRVVTFEEEA